jgi:hypothetical protein
MYRLISVYYIREHELQIGTELTPDDGLPSPQVHLFQQMSGIVPALWFEQGKKGSRLTKDIVGCKVNEKVLWPECRSHQMWKSLEAPLQEQE